MHPLIAYFAGYIIPALLGYFGMRSFPERRRAFLWAGMALSLAVLQLYLFLSGSLLPVHVSVAGGAAVIVAGVVAYALLGREAGWYAISAVLQQGVLVSAVWALLPLGFWWALVLVCWPFVAAHFEDFRWRWSRFGVTSLGGVASVLLFVLFLDFSLNLAAHVLAGSVALSQGLLDAEETGL